MVPTLKVSPLLWVEVNVLIAQLSSVVGSAHVTTALHTPASAVWVMLAGISEMVGSSSSVTVTLKVLVDELPWMSVAV